MFLMLALTARRFRLALVLYLGGRLVASLAKAIVVGANETALVPTDAFGAALKPIFGPGHNVVRLSLVALTTLVMAVTVARERRTSLEAVLGARRSANLSRYLPSGLPRMLAEAGRRGVKTWAALGCGHPVRRDPWVYRIV